MSTANQPLHYMRLQDRVAGPGVPLSLGAFIRMWWPTDPEPDSVRAIHITRTSDALSVACFGTGTTVPLESPPAPSSAIFAASPAARDGMAFFAEFDFGHMISRLQGNVNLGLLVLAGFHEFKDGSPYSNYFSREFFYAAEGPVPSFHPSNSLVPAKGAKSLDSQSLHGVWRNTNVASQGIVTLKVRECGSGLGVRVYGAAESGNLDWGESAAQIYGKDWLAQKAMAFSATSAAHGIRCHLQANVKQGVLVVAYFTEFQDGSGRSNYFSREFYYKEA